MIEAQLGLSREDLDAARVNLLTRQEERLAELYPAERALKYAQAAKAEEETRQAASLANVEKAKALADYRAAVLRGDDLAASIAKRKYDLAEAQLSDPLKRRREQGLIDYTEEQKKEIGQERRDKREQFESTHPEVEGPGGKGTYRVPGATLYTDTHPGSKGMTEDQIYRRQERLDRIERQAGEDAQKLQDTADEAEAIVLGRDNKGKPNIGYPWVQVSIDRHNRLSNNPYAYSRNPPNWVPKEYRERNQIPLEDADGKLRKVKDVYKVWKEYQAETKSNISFDEFIYQFIRRPK